jgi:hypothetical protein
MSRDLGIVKKQPAKEVPVGDIRGKIFANDINKIVVGVEASELEGTAQNLIDTLIGDTHIDLLLRYNLAKQI